MAEEYVIMPKSDYVSACDAIRKKTGKTGKIKSCDLCTEIDCITGGSSAGGSNGSVDSGGTGGSDSNEIPFMCLKFSGTQIKIKVCSVVF